MHLCSLCRAFFGDRLYAQELMYVQGYAMIIREVAYDDVELDSLVFLNRLRCCIEEGDILILKGFLTQDESLMYRRYLTSIGQSSLPNYMPIQVGAPNHHRLNDEDPRSYVTGCFHQFVFYPRGPKFRNDR